MDWGVRGAEEVTTVTQMLKRDVQIVRVYVFATIICDKTIQLCSIRGSEYEDGQ